MHISSIIFDELLEQIKIELKIIPSHKEDSKAVKLQSNRNIELKPGHYDFVCPVWTTCGLVTIVIVSELLGSRLCPSRPGLKIVSQLI